MSQRKTSNELEVDCSVTLIEPPGRMVVPLVCTVALIDGRL
jgi:hypothetical protein